MTKAVAGALIEYTERRSSNVLHSMKDRVITRLLPIIGKCIVKFSKNSFVMHSTASL